MLSLDGDHAQKRKNPVHKFRGLGDMDSQCQGLIEGTPIKI